MDNNKHYIVRAYGAGVFFGQIKERNGKEVTMCNARRLWHWNGATDCIQLACEGVKKPKDCKFTMIISEITLTDVVELAECTPEATANIREVAVWKM